MTQRSKMDIKETYRQGVFVVVFRKTKPETTSKTGIEYLLLKRKLHWNGWEFPKGGIDKGESLMKAVKRELKEETGLAPEKIIKFKLKGRYDYKRKLSDRPGYKGQTYSLFAVQVSSKSRGVKIDKIEHVTYSWLEFKKAIRAIHWSDQKKCLRAVDALLKKSKN